MFIPELLGGLPPLDITVEAPRAHDVVQTYMVVATMAVGERRHQVLCAVPTTRHGNHYAEGIGECARVAVIRLLQDIDLILAFECEECGASYLRRGRGHLDRCLMAKDARRLPSDARRVVHAVLVLDGDTHVVTEDRGLTIYGPKANQILPLETVGDTDAPTDHPQTQ